MIRRTFQVVSHFALVMAAFWADAPAVHAQQPAYPYAVDTKPSRGVMPNSEQLGGSLDSIDPISGKLHINIPLAALPAGNAGSGFDLSLTYDSHLFDLVASEGGQGQILQSLSSTLSGGGWRYNFQNYRVELEQRYIPTWEQPYCDGDYQYVMEHERIFRYRISLPDGSQHVLHLSGYGDEKGDGYYGDGFYAVNMSGVRSNCAHSSPARYPANANGLLTYYTTDGSYLRFQIYADGSSWWNKQWTLYYPDGRIVMGRSDQAEHIYDANGNGIHISKQNENGRTVAYILDDFSRSIRVEYGFTSSSTEKEDRITVSGPSGPLEWRLKWQKIQIGGPSSTYICWDEPGNPGNRWNCGLNAQVWVVKYIQLPLAAPYFQAPPAAPWTSFEFAYSPAGQGYGHLIWMRIPSGAEYSYCCDTYSANFLAEWIAYAGYSSRRVTHDGVTELWSYERISQTAVRVTNPDGGQVIYHFYNPLIASEFWSRNLVYWIEEPGGIVRKRQWTRNRVFSLRAAINIDPNNPYIERESTTVDKVAGQPRTVVKDLLIDKNGNVLQSLEYGWSTTFDGQSMESPGPLLRTTELAYYLSVPASADTENGADRYWHPSAPRRLNALARKMVRDESWSLRSITELLYDDALSRGNVTYRRLWDDAKPGCVASIPLSSSCPLHHREYDGFGNLTDVYEPEIRTHVTYAGPYPTLVEYAPGTGSYRSFAYSWNTAAGVLSSQTDLQNGVVTSYGYDVYGRLSLVDEAGQRQTQTFYDDENRSVLVKQDLRSRGDGVLQSRTHSDQLGRVDLVQTSDGSPLATSTTDTIKVRTAHRTFTGGTISVTSTPYRGSSDSTLEWTCTQKDQSGRVVAIAMFKGGTEPSDCLSPAGRTGITITEYHTETGVPRTRVIDPAGKISDSFVDPLGRLAAVVEDPLGLAYNTTYGYDALDNLVSATQSGSGATQQRTFSYTSLGRLRTAFNPESGTLQFTYNDSGDLLTRQDDRGFVTSLNYDELHRVVSKTYWNDGDITPDVTYSYHAAAPCAGHLRSVSSAAGTTSFNSCDALGRVLTQTQTIAGAGSFDFQYTYWLDGGLKTMQYPSGKVVSFDVDDAGRETRIYTQARTYADIAATGPSYTADGRLTKLKLGNNLWETRDYQTPGTTTTLRLGTFEGAADRLELQYNFSANGNNGNLQSHVIRQGGYAWSQTYEYDALNRLSCATERNGGSPAPACSWEDSWRQAFGYDRFGNRWVASSTGFTFSDIHEFNAESMIDKWTNRVVGSSYDAAGNQTWYAPWSLRYDAENRLLDATSASNGNSWFTYDGEGRRIKKVTANPSLQTTFYIYDAAGRLAAEYSSQPLPSGTSYLFSDLLGTPRAVTSADGSILECSDFSPFGRLLQTPTRYLPCHQNSNRVPQQFTGHPRDQETKLDFFGARYFSGAEGRFLSADWSSAPTPVPYANFSDPQTLNLYSYIRNNPLLHRDADGHCCSEHWDFFKQEMRGLWDTTGGSLVDAFQQIGSGQVVDNVRDTYLSGNVGPNLATAGSEFVSQSVGMVKAAAQGDPRAIGQLAGIVISGKAISAARGKVAAAGAADALPKPPFPENFGFLGTPTRTTLLKDTRIDRYGSDLGRYASPEGTVFRARSLKAAAESGPYSVFEVVKPFDVQAGATAPWFRMPGGGRQYYLPATVDQLLRDGYIKRTR